MPKAAIIADIKPEVFIPGAPDGGGALADYLWTVSDEIGWIPEELSAVGKDLQEAIENRNDPATWVAFAARTLQTVWELLPEEIRDQAREALANLIELGLDRVANIAATAASAAASGVATAIPIIGQIIESVVILIELFAKAHKTFESEKEHFSSLEKLAGIYRTIQTNDPDKMVYSIDRIENYIDYYKGVWRLRPSLARASGPADTMFLGISAPSDKGYWNKGVELKCPPGAFFDFDDCTLKRSSDQKNIAQRYTGVSSLFYPFWSSAYPDMPTIKLEVPGTEKIDPNRLLASQQFALLTSPSVNLRVNAKRLLDIRDTFKSFFFLQAEKYAPPGAQFGLLRVNGEHLAPGTAVADRLTIAPTQEENYVPTQGRKDKFYIDKDGLIQPYPGSGADPRKWGIRAVRGPQTPQGTAITVSQYNAVIGATLAFMSARANFLRDGPTMKALVIDYGTTSFDPGVRAALQYSADVGEPMSAPSLPPKKAFDPIVATPIGEGGGGLFLLGGAAAAGLFAYLRWGR